MMQRAQNKLPASKMSIQNVVPRFKPTTFRTWASSRPILESIHFIQIDLSQYQRVTRLSLTKKFVNCWSWFNQLANSWSQKCDNFPASFTDHVRLGYLDVPIAKKIRKTCMPSCAIDLQQRLFRCSHHEKICQWNSRKMVMRIFRQWKLGCTSQRIFFYYVGEVSLWAQLASC